MWQGTLSIQSCFPEGNSTPNSARSQPSSPRSQPSTMVTVEMPPKNLASVVVLPQPSSRSVVSLQLPDLTNTVIAEISNMVPSEVTSGPASASLLTSPLGLLRESDMSGAARGVELAGSNLSYWPSRCLTLGYGERVVTAQYFVLLPHQETRELLRSQRHGVVSLFGD